MNFGEIVRTLREEKGMTQQQLADECFISARMIRFIEQNDRTPSWDMIKRLSKVMGVPVTFAGVNISFN